MAKRQTRRSISVKGITYQRLKDFCDATGKSVSGYLEDIIAEKLDAAGAPTPTMLKPRPQRQDEMVSASVSASASGQTPASVSTSPSQAEPEEIVSQHFTF